MQSKRPAKQHTIDVLNANPNIKVIEKGEDLSKTRIEKAICDLKVELSNRNNVYLCITTTNSFRDDRLDIANTRMLRHKKISQADNKNYIYIVTSNCDNERTTGDDAILLNEYNFGNREMIGIDLLVRTKDISNLINAICNQPDTCDRNDLIVAGLDYLKQIGYQTRCAD